MQVGLQWQALLFVEVEESDSRLVRHRVLVVLGVLVFALQDFVVDGR